MPLLKRKPYELSDPPDDLKPKELVFQVRITKEIFRDYEEYLKRIHLYRQKVWTCKYTGRINLTYEEALLSEQKATEKVQQFPKEFMGPVLHLVQFSMLRLDDLVSAILKTFKDQLVVDEEVIYVNGNVTKACKILAFNQSSYHETGIPTYTVGWLSDDKTVTGSSIEAAENLVRKKTPPFTRALLKSFIRESVKDNASRNSQTPLVVLDRLCNKYGITTDPPQELKKFFIKQAVNNKETNGTNKRALIEDSDDEIDLNKKPKMMDMDFWDGGYTVMEGTVIQAPERNIGSIHECMKNGKSFHDDRKKIKNTGDKKAEKTKVVKNKGQAAQNDRKRSTTSKPSDKNVKEVKKDNHKTGALQGKKKAIIIKENKKKPEACKEDKKTKQNEADKIPATVVEKVPVVKVRPIKYPIEDTLVCQSLSDPPLPNKPVPSTDFPVPMECIGRLLMVWNFCTSFGKVIRLSPFSLEELGKALNYKEKDHTLLKEAHRVLIKLVLTDPAISQSFEEMQNRKEKVSIHSWSDNLCDLLEIERFKSLTEHSATIGNGNYRLLDPSVKLDILSELVDCGLGCTAIRERLDAYIEEKQAFAAQKRKEEMEESKKEKEAQDKWKQQTLEAAWPAANAGSTETSLRDANTQDFEVKNEDIGEEINSEEGMDSEESNIEKDVCCNGLSNGNQDDGNIEEESSAAAVRSRRMALKIKAELKQAEDMQKEKKMFEEQKKVKEIRKAKFEAVKERKLQEKQIIEQQKRQKHLEKEIEKRVIRTNPLGKDKDYNRYWFFPRDGRIFVEDEKSTNWGYYSTKDELDVFYNSLNTKGIRERALQRQLEKYYDKISDALQKIHKETVVPEDLPRRRSSRGRTTLKRQTENGYRNKYRN